MIKLYDIGKSFLHFFYDTLKIFSHKISKCVLKENNWVPDTI